MKRLFISSFDYIESAHIHLSGISANYARKVPLTLSDFTCFSQSWQLLLSSQDPDCCKFRWRDSKFRFGKSMISPLTQAMC